MSLSPSVNVRWRAPRTNCGCAIAALTWRVNNEQGQSGSYNGDAIFRRDAPPEERLRSQTHALFRSGRDVILIEDEHVELAARRPTAVEISGRSCAGARHCSHAPRPDV
jgi:hypothetical protein